MNVQTPFGLSQPLHSYGLPADVHRLFPRERQIATYVYEEGCASAKDVEAALDRRLKNAAVRSMLNRLVKKGVLARHELGSGTYLYSPALTEVSVQERLIRQFADDYYGGSLSALIGAIAELTTDSPPPTRSEIREKEREIRSAETYA